MDEKRMMEYIHEGGKLLTVTSIDTLRDGGTTMVTCVGDTKFYIDKEYILHNSYPMNSGNIVQDKNEIAYIIELISKHLSNIKLNLNRNLSTLTYLENKNTLWDE